MTQPMARVAVLFVFAAGVFWSTQGLAIRMIEEASAWQILFYRSLALSMFLALVLNLRPGASAWRSIRKSDRVQLLGALCLVAAYALGILAMQRTSIADAVLLFATAPFFAAVLGWLVLKEPVARTTWVAITLAMGGIVVMQGGAIAGGTAMGNLFAVGSALGFALFTLVLRARKDQDMLSIVLLSGLLATFICAGFIFAQGRHFAVPQQDIAVAALMGVFQTGAGLVLYTLGARYVPAVQLALLPLIEVILSPLWVALVIGEVPARIVVLGGLLVGVAIIGDALLTTRKSR